MSRYCTVLYRASTTEEGDRKPEMEMPTRSPKFDLFHYIKRLSRRAMHALTSVQEEPQKYRSISNRLSPVPSHSTVYTLHVFGFGFRYFTR